MTKDEKFQNQVIRYLQQINATEEGELGYKWRIKTPIGDLDLDMHNPEPRQKIFSIFGRFKDPNRAKTAVDCNPYSGKWNFHEYKPSDCFEEFKYQLERILKTS